MPPNAAPSEASTPLIIPELVRLDALPGSGKKDVIEFLAQVVASAGRADTPEGLAGDAIAREETAPTGIPGGIAIPHCRSPHVLAPSLGFARLAEAVDFGAADGQAADLVFMIAAPAGADDFHLQLLAKLARGLMNPDFTDALRKATTPEDVARIVTEQVEPEPDDGKAAGPAAEAQAPEPAADGTVIVGVSSCPTGIAHTYMAAEALEQAGKERGVTVSIEGQGSGKIDWLDPALIKRADAVVFAHDLPVKGRDRFAGKPMVDVGVKAAVNDAGALVDQALAAMKDPNAVRVPAGVARPVPDDVLHEALARADERDRTMILLGAYAGLRCMEIARVHSRDWDGSGLYVTGKGGKTRYVPIVRMDLRRALSVCDGYLFPGQDGGHLSAGYVSKRLARALPAGWTGHTLRHRCGTAMYAGTRDLLAVGAVLGHARPETTRRYVRLPDDALISAVRAAA